MDEWIWNPKTKGSGIITCIPQVDICPNKCEDCFFQSGRSYLEPLEKNLPHIPSKELAKGRIVRMNDGNDSNIERDLVEQTAQQYDDYFFNTAIPDNLGGFSNPVVLTVNPGLMTNKEFHKLTKCPMNLMYVRVRVNAWNLDLVKDVVGYYTFHNVPVVLTFMAYYTAIIPNDHIHEYMWKKRTLNSYWVLTPHNWQKIMDKFKDDTLVYSCGRKYSHACKDCGNCLREYYATKERTK